MIVHRLLLTRKTIQCPVQCCCFFEVIRGVEDTCSGAHSVSAVRQSSGNHDVQQFSSLPRSSIRMRRIYSSVRAAFSRRLRGAHFSADRARTRARLRYGLR